MCVLLWARPVLQVGPWTAASHKFTWYEWAWCACLIVISSVDSARLWSPHIPGSIHKPAAGLPGRDGEPALLATAEAFESLASSLAPTRRYHRFDMYE